MEFLTIANWQEYQHYTNRNPPWIKLHRDILNSPMWVMLDDASRLLAVAIMIIGSRFKGKIPADPAYIKKVAHLDKIPNFKPLIEIGFLVDASGMLALASGLQANAIIEERREYRIEEKRKEEEIVFSWLPEVEWKGFIEMRNKKKEPMTDLAKQRMISKLEKFNTEGSDIAKILEQSILNNWKDVFPLRAQVTQFSKEQITERQNKQELDEWAKS